MRGKHFVFAATLIATASLWALTSSRVHAQTSHAASKSASANNSASAPDKTYDWKASFAKVPTGKVPRTADGKPDLQGIWSFSILTPLNRPGAQKNTEINAVEAEEIEDAAQKAEINLRVESTKTPPGEKTTDAYNTFWRDGYWYKVPMTVLHTSQVVDPPDGQVPPLTALARERQDETGSKLGRSPNGPEDPPTTNRCVRSLTSGPPIIGQGPGSQETTLEIVQGPGAVVVRESMDSQIIPLDGRPRPPESVHLDKGVARGHWEGDTLVVESTNFAEWASGFFSNYGTTEKMHLTERWKRLDDTHMLYGFTIDDPGTWTRPWSVEFVMWRLTNQEQLVEYACHAGNVWVAFALSGARAKEKEAQQQAKENGGQSQQ
jgi:hypothetical protein